MIFDKSFDLAKANSNQSDKKVAKDKRSAKSLIFTLAHSSHKNNQQELLGSEMVNFQQSKVEREKLEYNYGFYTNTSSSSKSELLSRNSSYTSNFLDNNNSNFAQPFSASFESGRENTFQRMSDKDFSYSLGAIDSSNERLTPSSNKNVPFSYDYCKKFTLYSQHRSLFIQSDSLDDLNLEGSCLLADLQNQDSPSSLLEEGLVWVDVCGASDAELEQLAHCFSIHPLTIEDIQEGESETREKFEIYQNYMFFAAKCLRPSSQKRPGGNLEYSSLFIVMFENFILSFHRTSLAPILVVMRRIFAVKEVVEAMTAEWILYSLLDATTDEYKPSVVAVQQQVDSIEDTILGIFSFSPSHLSITTSTSPPDPLMCRIASAKRTVTRLNRLLIPKVEMLKDLLRKGNSKFKEYTFLYMRDILDHALRMIQQLDSYGESLERSHNNYLAQINIELGETSNQLNLVMKKMTACTIVIMPLNLIASIWGMNVAVPGYGQSGSYWPFFAILVFMMAAVLLTAVISKRFHWF